MSESRKLYFGSILLDERQVFYETENIIGIVNIKPILPDHVLVIPKSTGPMEAPKVFSEMTPDLISELYIAVHTIQRAIIDNRKYITGFNIAMQDGKDAGQSVPHVHVHILPRKGGEFDPPEQVHREIEKANVSQDGNNSQPKGLTSDEIRSKMKTMEEMEADALVYRGWFTNEKTDGGGFKKQRKNKKTKRRRKRIVNKRSKKGRK